MGDLTTRLRASWDADRSIISQTDGWMKERREAAAEIERLRYVLEGVRGAIKTGRNEPLVIWKEQIDIVLEDQSCIQLTETYTR